MTGRAHTTSGGEGEEKGTECEIIGTAGVGEKEMEDNGLRGAPLASSADPTTNQILRRAFRAADWSAMWRLQLQ